MFIGRDSTNPICVPDIEVSRRHCRLTREGDEFLLSDLGSSNGTFVNGDRIKQCELRSGDQIRVGATVLVFNHQYTPNLAILDTARPSKVVDSKFDSASDRRMGSRLDDESTYYDVFNDEQEASRRFIQVGNDLRFIYHASLATSLNSDCEQMLSEVLDLVFDWIAADRGRVLLKKGSSFEVCVTKCRPDKQNHEDFFVSKSIIDYVCQQKVGVLSARAATDERWGVRKDSESLDIGEVICVPILGRDEVLGMIYVDTILLTKHREFKRFNEDHLKLLIAMAHQAAVAIEHDSFHRALLEKERLAAIGQTTGIIAHHVKNTIQGINGGSHLIESGLQSSDLETIEKGWQIVNRNQEQISRLVIDMLILGRTYEPNLKPGDINQAVREAIDQLEYQLATYEVKCEFKPLENPTEFKFEHSGIANAISHMLNSSLLASRFAETRLIKIEVKQSDEMTTIEIEDQGEHLKTGDVESTLSPFGIDSEEHFYGIGLAVSQKIILGHGGELALEKLSKSGNRFRMQLPLK
jgi:signal transduction histidine kinase